MDPTKFILALELIAAFAPIALGAMGTLLKEHLGVWFSRLSAATRKIFFVTMAVLQTVYAIVSLAFTVFFAGLITNLAFSDTDTILDWLPFITKEFLTDNFVVLVSLQLMVGFAILCQFWHRFLFAFPVVMRFFSRLVSGKWDAKKFPKIIDYGYYFFGALVLFNLVVASQPGQSVDPIILRIEVLGAVIFLSLKFVKVSLELVPEKYLVEDIRIRTFDGTVLFPLKV